ncbi:MAG: PQQ-dependent sugar dehydrogenase [Cellvibrionaceae bacterium]
MRIKLLVAITFLLNSFAFADFKTQVITNGLQQPWGFTKLPDGRFLVTEKSGQLRLVDQQGNISNGISVPGVDVVGQGGLLDVVLHPDFSENNIIYLSYAAGNRLQGHNTEVVRAVLKDKKLSDIKKIFVALPKVKGGRHFGSRLVFDREGFLYISLGDRGRRSESQNLKSHIGSIIRLHDDGKIPEDNPFIGIAGAKPEIYSYGHRNVQGMTVHPQTGQVWAHEHGPQGGDEVNLIEKGRNYGWPIITYGAEYGSGLKIGEGNKKAGMTQPAHYWDPSIAPSGMAFFNDQLWVGALKYQLLASLTLKKQLVLKEDRFFAGEFGRIRDVKSFEGALYIITDSQQGQLIRITPSSR